jgi:hypothetical protein
MSFVGGGDVPRLRDAMRSARATGWTATMNRREFLIVTGAGAIAIAGAGCAPDARYETGALARPAVLAALGPDVTRAIGTRYRSMASDERDAGSLRRRILASRPWSARLTGRPPSVAELVADDFEHGRTVTVDGWILSATEARQCALFSLLAS